MPEGMRRPARTASQRLETLLTLQTLMSEVSRELGPATELQPVLATVLNAMRSLIDFRGGSVCLVEDHHIRIAASDPPVSEEVLAARLPVGKGLVGRWRPASRSTPGIWTTTTGSTPGSAISAPTRR